MIHDVEGSRRKMRHLGITAGALGLFMAGVLAITDSLGAAHLGVVLVLVVTALALGGRSTAAAMLLAVLAIGVDIWIGYAVPGRSSVFLGAVLDPMLWAVAAIGWVAGLWFTRRRSATGQ